MERKHFLKMVLLLVFLSSCSAPQYVPKVEEVPFSAHGSHIEVQKNTKATIEGELIAVDVTGLTVLTDASKQLHIVSFEDIEKFKLSYAQPNSYAWTIPVYTLSTLSHGVLLMITAPANIAITSVVTARGANAFTYNQTVISYEDLRMFARFPQGIPPNIEPLSIR